LDESGGQLPVGFLDQPALVVVGEHLAGHSPGGLNHQLADFLSEFGQHPGVVSQGDFAGLGNDLFGGGDGLLGFLFLHAGGGGPGFLDQLNGLAIRSVEDLLAGLLRLGQFRLDLFGVGQALGDACRRSSSTRRMGL
jgi:hypothetical protein